MKKVRLAILSFILMFTTIIAFSGCWGEKIGPEIDPNKTQIYVSMYDGGYGTTWAQSAADEINAKYPKYQVFIKPNVDEESNILSTFASGYPSADIYYTTTLANMKGMIAGGYLLDLTDVYSSKADETESRTIEQKTNNIDLYKEVFKDSVKGTEGTYALPYGDSFIAPVYDNGTFVEKAWAKFAAVSESAALTEQGITYEPGTHPNGTAVLKFKSATGKTNFKEGDIILSAGKDGKYGTYDDGQPQTVAEFDELMLKIKAASSYPFIWSGTFLDYALPFTDTIFAQYEGLENYKTFYNYTGTLNGETITPQSGYKVWDMPGFEKAVSYTYKYLYGGGTNYHPAADSASVTHSGAQSYFILGKDNTNNPISAMLFDGVWWENEARATFKDVEADGRGYGKRDYRFMLFPKMEGQKGADGNGNGSIVTATDTGAVFAYKSKNDEKNMVIKEFLKLTTSDKYLKEFTKGSGGIRPFDYEISDEILSSLTPCQRNAWELYHDTENISVTRNDMYRLLSPIGYGSSKAANDYTCVIKNSTYTMPIVAFMAKRNIDDIAYTAAVKSYYADKWSTYQ